MTYPFYAVRGSNVVGFSSSDQAVRYVLQRADRNELWTVGRRVGDRVVRL